jgi:hypothetical protein
MRDFKCNDYCCTGRDSFSRVMFRICYLCYEHDPTVFSRLIRGMYNPVIIEWFFMYKRWLKKLHCIINGVALKSVS